MKLIPLAKKTLKKSIQSLSQRLSRKKSDAISPTFCVYPWMECIVGPTPHLKICCIAEKPVRDENNRVYNLEQDSLKDYWNSYGLRLVRKKMLAGEKIKACEHCYYQESLGRSSYRQSFNKQWLGSELGKNILNRVEKSRTNGFRVEEPPLYLDIRPGNLCNLKCRMCNPGNSSKIYKERKEMLKEDPVEFAPLVNTSYFNKPEKELNDWHKNPDLWNHIYQWSEKSKQLYFTGGEPTLIKQNWDLIQYLKQKGFSKNMDLIFNLNCTQIPDKLLDTFSNFSNITLSLSIDGYKHIQEYIRHPSKWHKVEQNIITMLKHRNKNTHFYFSPVIQVYNILDISHFFQWVEDLKNNYGTIGISLIMCTDPKFLDIAILPKSIRKLALQKLEDWESSWTGQDKFFLDCLKGIKNVLKQKEIKDISYHLKRFYKYTYALDKKRNNNFQKNCPELYQLLEKDGRWRS